MSWFVFKLPFSQVSKFVTDPPGDSVPPLLEVQSPENPEDPEEAGLSEMQQVVITSICH